MCMICPSYQLTPLRLVPSAEWAGMQGTSSAVHRAAPGLVAQQCGRRLQQGDEVPTGQCETAVRSDAQAVSTAERCIEFGSVLIEKRPRHVPATVHRSSAGRLRSVASNSFFRSPDCRLSETTADLLVLCGVHRLHPRHGIDPRAALGRDRNQAVFSD